MTVALAQLLKTDHAALSADDALRAPVDVLLGISATARSALDSVNIRTVFDLAAAELFATAALLLSAETNPVLAEVRLNTVAAGAVVPPPGVPVGEWARRDLSLLAGLSATQAHALSEALDVRTVRDLALWPPYLTARTLLQETFGGATPPEPDPEAPADLVPRSGGYATERVFFKKLVIELAPQADQGATPVEQLNGIDLDTALAAPTGFQRLATGALLTFKQSWFSHGVTLGHLLHSLALAPGESTRVAVIDWTRRSSARAAESIDESERLANEQTHARAMSEVTSSTASEFQAGSSSTEVTSSASQTGASLGLELGPFAFGGSHGSSSSTTEAMSASSSFGARDLAASLGQTVNDRTQQNASAARDRRASAVREVSQSERETITTRVVTNYNHMHALTVQYYETVQAYRVTTELDRAERCLFVPLKLLNFRAPATVERLRSTLAQVALTPVVFLQLTSEYGAVEIIPQTPRVAFGNVGLSDLFVRDHVTTPSAAGGTGAGRGESTARRATATSEAASRAEPAAPGEAAPSAASPSATVLGSSDLTLDAVHFDRGPATTPTAIAAVKGWNLMQLNLLGSLAGQAPLRKGSDSAFVPHDALLLGVALRDGQAARFQIRARDSAELSASSLTATSQVLARPVAFSAVQHISLQNAQDRDVSTTLVLSVSVNGAVVALDVPVQYKSKATAAGLQEIIRFGAMGPAPGLVEHLEANRLHYSRAIFQRLDDAAIGGLLARHTYRGLALARVVDPRPVAVTSNFLVFRVNVPLEGGVDDDRFMAEQSEFKAFLQERGLDRPAPQSQIVALPSGGVFAEAVLGRFNSAEKIDLTRFWNWQNSPIPITAPEIAPVAAGSRAEEETLRPGQLGAPIVTIQSPTPLPAAAGVGPMLSAIQTANLFRDMSGMVQTAALAQTAVQASSAGATAAGDQAAQNLKTTMEQKTQRMKIAADMLGAMTAPAAGAAAAAGAKAGVGGAAPAVGQGSDTHVGGVLNAANAIDQKDAAGAAGSPAAGGGATAGSLEKETLARQTGSDVAGAAEKLVETATTPTPPPARQPARRTTSRPAPAQAPTPTTPADPGAPTGTRPALPPTPRRYRLKIAFGTTDGVALEGSRHAQLIDSILTFTPLSEAAGLSGQALYLAFQTLAPTASLEISVQPRATGESFSAVKTLTFLRAMGIFSGSTSADPQELSVVVRPSIKKETFTVPFLGVGPDMANLEQQLTVKGVQPARRIGDPEFTFIFGTGYRATVRWFTGSLLVQQIL